MFDKMRRKASRAAKRVTGIAVEDEAERQTEKQISKVRSDYQASIDKTVEQHAFRGQVTDKRKVKGEMITHFMKFKSAWEKKADDPAESVFFLLIAAYNYCSNDKAIGEAMATVILSKKFNDEDSSSPSGLKFGKTNRYLFEQMRDDEHIAKSYLGADYTKDYKFDADKPNMQFIGVVPEGDKQVKAIIQSSGKDYPTPVTLAKNKFGQWKITEFSSIATGCKIIKSIEEDF